jgi:hypothetical protein
MLKSKFFYLNLIAILVLVVQYFINNQILTQYAVYEGLIIVVLNDLPPGLATHHLRILSLF